jgi:hypothetical protein
MALAHALLHGRDELVGMVPPLTWSTNSKPVPRGKRLDAQEHLAELAAPPLCFLWRWWPSAGAVIVSR